MMKAMMKTPPGAQKILMLGLSFGNLRKFMDMPGDTFIKIDGKEMGLPVDIVLFSGETEAHMMRQMQDSITPDTVMHIDEKLKS